MRFHFDSLITKQALKSVRWEFRPMIKIKRTHITNMRPLACLDGDLKSGVSVADLILIMGLKPMGLIFFCCHNPCSHI